MKRAAFTLVELLVVVALLVVLLAPMLHLYVLTTRGLKGGAEELAGTELCLRVLEGLQSQPLSELPEDFPEAPVAALPARLLERIGWEDSADFVATVKLSTRFAPAEDSSLAYLAPSPLDPRRERIRRQGELRVVEVRCRAVEDGLPGPRSLVMSTLVGRSR